MSQHCNLKPNTLFGNLQLGQDVREGVNVTIPTLSSNEIQLHIQPNSRMVTQQKCKVIPNEGMPVRQSKGSAAPQTGAHSRGNLVIKFLVRMVDLPPLPSLPPSCHPPWHAKVIGCVSVALISQTISIKM